MKIKFRAPQFSYPDDYTTRCDLWGIIKFNGIKKVLNGQGDSYRENDDVLDKELGDGLAKVRALKDFANDAENYLIKQSCIGHEKYQFFGDIFDASLSLDLKDIPEDVRRVFMGDCRIDTVPNAKLKSLVGKWAIRTKTVIYDDGTEDKSYSIYSNIMLPIFIVSAKEDTAVYYVKGGPTPNLDYTHELTGVWLDNNWKEWEPELILNQTLKGLVGKWAQRTKPVTYSNGLEDYSFSGEPIFIRSANDTCMEFSHKKYDKWEPDDHISFLTGKWIDNNWVEYNKTKKGSV